MCHGDEGRFARCSFKRSIACRESIASVETALRPRVRVSAGRVEQDRRVVRLQSWTLTLPG